MKRAIPAVARMAHIEIKVVHKHQVSYSMKRGNMKVKKNCSKKKKDEIPFCKKIKIS